jgi:hypothetical protein
MKSEVFKNGLLTIRLNLLSVFFAYGIKCYPQAVRPRRYERYGYRL